MKCNAFLIANSIDIKAIPSDRKLREVCYLNIKDNSYVIFPYGVVVCWGDGKLGELIAVINKHLTSPIPPDLMIIDEFDVNLNTDSTGKLVFEDCINLQDAKDELVLVAISHAIAQSLRLTMFEESILENIEKIQFIPSSLAEHGKIKEPKKKISQLQGTLYLLKGKFSFEHSVLDKPEFFWEYPEYDDYYEKISTYLEMKPRIDILHTKMNTIDETLSILSQELNHRHSSKLEIIIILLILIEIVIFLLQDVFKII